MTPQALKYAEEFLGVFAPAMPPQGWLDLLVEQADWPKFDERTGEIILAVDRALMPKPIYGESGLDGDTRKHCQAFHPTPGEPGYGEPCWRLASITDPKTSSSYCVRCWLATQ